jgi:hypothetical protein
LQTGIVLRLERYFNHVTERVTPRWIATIFLLAGLLAEFNGPIPYIAGLYEFYKNVSAEFIGIGLTVLIIDTANKRREEQNWKPVKNRAYIKVMRLMDDFISSYYSSKNIEHLVTFYGDAHHISSSYKEDLDFDLLKEHIALSTEIDSLSNKPFDLTPAENLKRGLQDIFNSASYLLDANLLQKLFHLDYQTIRIPDQADSLATKQDSITLIVYFSIEIYIYLETYADKQIPINEYIRDYFVVR